MQIDPAVVTVFRSVPEFASRLLSLVEAADGDPGPAAAFAELAEFVADLVRDLGVSGRPLLDRCLFAVEEVAVTSPDATELVGWAFLDSLAPEETEWIRPWLGPRTLALLDDLEGGALDDLDDLDDPRAGTG